MLRLNGILYKSTGPPSREWLYRRLKIVKLSHAAIIYIPVSDP